MSDEQIHIQDDEVIQKYIELRDEIDRIENESKARVEPLKANLATMETWFQDQFNKRGVESSKTKHGTAFTQTKTQVSVDNMDFFVKFVDENKAWNFLNKVVNKTAVEEYIAQHNVPPPGVKTVTMRVVQVRRPK